MACKSTIFSSEVAARYRTGTATSSCPPRATEPTPDSLAGGLAWGSVLGGDPHKGVSLSMPIRTNSSEATAKTACRRGDDFGPTGSDVRGGEVLTTAQAAATLGVHERTVRRYLSSGLLAGRRLPGGHYRIPAAALAEFWHANDASTGSQERRRPRDRDASDPQRNARERRAPSRSHRGRLQLGQDARRDYDLSAATLRALRARLS
jgi:excisionase family DNA binding protein